MKEQFKKLLILALVCFIFFSPKTRIKLAETLESLSFFFYSTVREGDSNKWFIKRPGWLKKQKINY